MLKHHAPRMFLRAVTAHSPEDSRLAQSVASSPDKKADEDVSRRLMELEKETGRAAKANGRGEGTARGRGRHRDLDAGR